MARTAWEACAVSWLRNRKHLPRKLASTCCKASSPRITSYHCPARATRDPAFQSRRRSFLAHLSDRRSAGLKPAAPATVKFYVSPLPQDKNVKTPRFPSWTAVSVSWMSRLEPARTLKNQVAAVVTFVRGANSPVALSSLRQIEVAQSQANSWLTLIPT